MTSSGVPYVELYRPKTFEDIVLDPLNKKILTNIIETSYFPNLLFYGPPGTGKTTTIINLINAYQTKLNNKNKDRIIHLNASDERGVDIIRNQINFFVNSKPLFNTGTKISVAEKLNISQKSLSCVQKLYKSDIRSMVNFMQSNQDIVKMQTDAERANFDIIDDDVWDSLIAKIQAGEGIRELQTFVHELSSKYNIDKKNIIKDFFNYIIRSHPKYICKEFMSFIENLMHSEIQDNNVHLHYSLSRLPSFISTH